MSLLSIIAAMSDDHTIGLNGTMPWHLPADLKRVKQITQYQTIIMGRKTFEEIGRTLPNRDNIVITRQRDWTFPGAIVFHSIEDAIDAYQHKDELIIFGGASLYERMLPFCQRMYLTMIHQNIKGDTAFPRWNEQEWTIVKKESFLADDKNPYPYSFIDYERIGSKKEWPVSQQ